MLNLNLNNKRGPFLERINHVVIMLIRINWLFRRELVQILWQWMNDIIDRTGV